MLFVKIEDAITGLELLVFPKIYQETLNLWQEEKVLIVEGKFSLKDGDPKVLVNQSYEINDQNISMVIDNLKSRPTMKQSSNGTMAKKAVIDYPKGASKELAEQVKELFLKFPGNEQVVLQIGNKQIQTNFRINKNKEFDEKLKEVFKR